jgi:1-aminocyclopropane-1-carboxylate deaminase/D-cysteine desulfhydrase-like pyridoxal-dependent ACC family enzyme
LHHGLKRLSLLADRKDDDNNSDYSYSARSMMDIEVVVVPCVGDAAYARKQMMSLSTQIGAKADDIPTILQPGPEEQEKLTSSSRRKYFTFGKPNKEILETFQELQKESNLLVDLLYGAPSFAVMFRHWEEDIKNNKDKSSLSPDLSFDPNQPLSAGREIMYVHSGGLEGITSQLLRYQHIGLMKIKDVQLPGRRNKKKGTEHTNT